LCRQARFVKKPSHFADTNRSSIVAISDTMSDSVGENGCAVCSQVRASERSAFRAKLAAIPLKEPICNACLMAWARNVGFPVTDDGPTQH
jgi:hypothetical protein